MSIIISLNDQIDCSRLCDSIQKLIENFAKNNKNSVENCILYIQIKECVETKEEPKKLTYIE